MIPDYRFLFLLPSTTGTGWFPTVPFIPLVCITIVLLVQFRTLPITVGYCSDCGWGRLIVTVGLYCGAIYPHLPQLFIPTTLIPFTFTTVPCPVIYYHLVICHGSLTTPHITILYPHTRWLDGSCTPVGYMQLPLIPDSLFYHHHTPTAVLDPDSDTPCTLYTVEPPFGLPHTTIPLTFT